MLLKFSTAATFIVVFATACEPTASEEQITVTTEEIQAPDMTQNPQLNAEIETELAQFEASFNEIPEERKASLNALADYIREQVLAGKPADVTFICTHNSRRSHMSQLWAKAAAVKCDLPQVNTYSGGTEATAFNPRSVKALRACGFAISDGAGENPHYTVTLGEGIEPVEAFSKKYDDPFNPQSEFCAVMTCSDADEACPIVRGADARVSLPYIDPKLSDNTPQEDSTYLARSREIGRELYWAMRQVKP